jgi:hypothetical protein
MSRVEVLPGAERRRRWTAEQKRSIVAEAFAPGASETINRLLLNLAICRPVPLPPRPARDYRGHHLPRGAASRT